jgi:hypothetical protein
VGVAEVVAMVVLIVSKESKPHEEDTLPRRPCFP